MRRSVALTVLLLVAAGAAAREEPGPVLRLVPLRDGLRTVAPGHDLARLDETDLARKARRVDLDLDAPPHPLLAAGYARGRLFYVFFKNVEEAFGPRPWLLQRIRKTERFWRTPQQVEPEVRVTHLVEAFALVGGALKRPDRHYGDYGLREYHRREVLKEYEIGFGTIPGEAEGTAWPFGGTPLFEILQPWQEEPDLHARVVFESRRRWTLFVAFDAEGGHAVRAPEFGIDAPTSLPGPEATLAPPEASTAGLVLREGRGVGALVLGEPPPAEGRDLLGDCLEVAPAGRGHENLSFEARLVVNLDARGRVHTIRTRPGFAGRTEAGIGLGDGRARVMEAYGPPRGQMADAPYWRFEGVLFHFDALNRVRQVVLVAP